MTEPTGVLNAGLCSFSVACALFPCCKTKRVKNKKAKLDLGSAVGEASTAGGKAGELQSQLEAALGEIGETKARLEGESAANTGLKAAIMETNQV